MASQKDVLEACAILKNPDRLEVLKRINLEGEISVGDAMDALGMVQGSASVTMSSLCNAGILDRRRDGTSVFYHYNRENSLAITVIDILDLIVPEKVVRRRNQTRSAVKIG